MGYCPEELGTKQFHGGNHQGTVEEVIALFAGGLRDQQTSVARTAQQGLVIVWTRGMEGTHRVVRAERAHVQGSPDVGLDSTPGFDQAAKRPLGIRRTGVDQHAILTWHRVHPLTDG